MYGKDFDIFKDKEEVCSPLISFRDMSRSQEAFSLNERSRKLVKIKTPSVSASSSYVFKKNKIELNKVIPLSARGPRRAAFGESNCEPSILYPVPKNISGSSSSHGFEIIPGPGEYDPVHLAPHEPTYAIGNRSRKRQSKPTITAIGVFMIQTFNELEVQKYLISKPGLKQVLDELADMVLSTKPQDPLGFIRNFFFNEKESLKPKIHCRNLDMF